MIKKIFILIATTLITISCSANKKNSDNSTKTKEIAITKDTVITEVTMFSVTKEEIEESKAIPQVIYFDTNSAKLNNAAIKTLAEKVLAEAKNSKTKKVVIEAHCDERGSTYYNQKLSEKRAKAVKNYLVKNGVKSVKIRTVGYGESKPVALGHDEESWSKNRRAVTVSLKK